MQIAGLGGRVVDGLKRLTHQITECRGLDRRVTEEPSLHLAGGTTAAAADSSGALGPQISGKKSFLSLREWARGTDNNQTNNLLWK